MNIRAIMILAGCLAWFGPAFAAPTSSELQNGLPPIVSDSTKAEICTVTYLVTDVTTNDMLAARMQISPDPNDQPTNGRMPCPSDIPPRMASRALDACVIRAANPKDCVFADMGRDFEQRPIVDNTAENNSRCTSDKASHIGVACWRAGDLEICDAGCGDSPASATAAARDRCQAKHQRQCPITGSLPVLAPK